MVAREGEASWIREDNRKVRRSLERVGATVHKTYRVYTKPLPEGRLTPAETGMGDQAHRRGPVAAPPGRGINCRGPLARSFPASREIMSCRGSPSHA
jgi:hypothetical protein